MTAGDVDFSGLRRLSVGGVTGVLKHSAGISSLLPLKQNHKTNKLLISALTNSFDLNTKVITSYCK